MTTDSSHARWFTAYVHTLMTAILADPEPDADGDFPVHGTTAQAWVRVEPVAAWGGVQVFALAAEGVPDKVAVLRELNDVVLHQPAIRALLLPGGRVMLDYRVLADAVTESTLRAVIAEVLKVADEIGPMITAVHGGKTPISAQSTGSDR